MRFPSRADIDGLRAVSVGAAIVFAVAPNWLPGGNGGLDMLLVAAGFLVTSTVLAALDDRGFDLWAFYRRRVARVLPALLVMIVVVFVAGWFFLFAREYRELGRDMAGGVLIVRSEQPTRLLLHLARLTPLGALYLGWPLVLMILHRRAAILEAIVAALLVLSVAFDFLFGVALAMGCGLALLQRRGIRWHGVGCDRAAMLGLLFVGIGFAISHGPLKQIFPALGATLLLSAGPAAFLPRRVLGSPLLVAVGAIAHPLYVWFWPLLVFAYVDASGSPSHGARLAALAAALAAAIATHLLVERPMRGPAQPERKTVGTIATALAAGGLGLLCYGLNGFPGTGFRDPARQAFLDSYAGKTSVAGCEDHCTERDTRVRHAVLLWGDEHAQELYGGLRRHLPADWQILQVAQPGCLPDIRTTEPAAGDLCEQMNWKALQTIRAAKPEVVIVAREYGHLIRIYNATGPALAKLGATRTLFVGPTPHWRVELPEIVARNFWQNTPRRLTSGIAPGVVELNNILLNRFRTTDEQAFVDVIGAFCNTAGCLTYLGDDPRTGLTSPDGTHLTPAASDFLAREVLVRMVVSSVHE